MLVYPLSHFMTSAAPLGPALVIGYARLAPRQLEEAIQILASVIASRSPTCVPRSPHYGQLGSEVTAWDEGAEWAWRLAGMFSRAWARKKAWER